MNLGFKHLTPYLSTMMRKNQIIPPHFLQNFRDLPAISPPKSPIDSGLRQYSGVVKVVFRMRNFPMVELGLRRWNWMWGGNSPGSWRFSFRGLAMRGKVMNDSPMDKELLLKALNEDLEYEFAAIIQYTTYAAQATGPFRPQLAQFFLAEVADEQGHAQFLANKIVALGGVPTRVAAEVPAADSNRAMVEAILRAEQSAVARYTERAKQAEALGQKGLVVQLEDMVRDESDHSEESERILRDWPL